MPAHAGRSETASTHFKGRSYMSKQISTSVYSNLHIHLFSRKPSNYINNSKFRISEKKKKNTNVTDHVEHS